MYMGAVSYKDMFAPPPLSFPPPPNAIRASWPPRATSSPSHPPPPPFHLGQFSATSLEIEDGL
jgi:hypothetical protein